MGAQFPSNRIESVPPNPKNSIFSIRNRFIRLFTRSAGVPSDVPSRPPAIQSLFVSDWPRRIAGRQHGLDDCARLVQCFLRRDPMFLRAAIRPISLAGCAMVVSLMLAATSDPSCPATDMSSRPRIVLYGSRSRTRIIRSARSRSVSTSTCRTTAAFCLCTSTRNGGCVRYGSGRSLTFPNGPSFCCGAPPICGTRCWQCARVISVPIWGPPTDGCGCGRPLTRWASPGWMGCWASPPCPMIHIVPSMNACALPSHGRISACVPNAHSRRNLPGLDGVRGIRSGRTSANGQSSPKWRNSVARTYQYPGCCLTWMVRCRSEEWHVALVRCGSKPLPQRTFAHRASAEGRVRREVCRRVAGIPKLLERRRSERRGRPAYEGIFDAHNRTQAGPRHPSRKWRRPIAASWGIHFGTRLLWGGYGFRGIAIVSFIASIHFPLVETRRGQERKNALYTIGHSKVHPFHLSKGASSK